MKTKTQKAEEFKVEVTLKIDLKKIEEWQDEYPDAQPTQKDVQAMVQEALDEYVNGMGTGGLGAGDGYCDGPEGPVWIASMLPTFEVK